LKDKEKLAQEELLEKQEYKIKKRQRRVENNVSFHT
jgi:hypothetical protein